MRRCCGKKAAGENKKIGIKAIDFLEKACYNVGINTITEEDNRGTDKTESGAEGKQGANNAEHS